MQKESCRKATSDMKVKFSSAEESITALKSENCTLRCAVNELSVLKNQFQLMQSELLK